MKKITRRQIDAWFHPMRKCFAQMRQGEVDSIKGYAVTRLHSADDYVRTDYCIEGWLCCLKRVLPGLDTAPMQKLQKKIANGTPITIQEIDAAMRVLRAAEKPLLRTPWQAIKDAVMTEQIQIEIDAMGLAS